MTRQKILFIASIITCYLLQAQGADKYTDENRPYEFGFTIDGEQHRHEEKDKNGIIKGEYGFITADGVYHVTVYATDEQGRFKILSMKNIRYRDYKGLSGTLSTARQGHSLQLPSPQPEITSQKSTSILAPVSKPAQEFETISIEPPANSCSHCSLPTTSTAAPEVHGSPINFASNLPNAQGQSNSFDAGRTQYTSTSNTVSVNNRNNFNVQSDQKQNYFNENQGSRQGPSAPGPQNNYYTQQNNQQQPNESIKPSGFSEATNIGQVPNVPGQQYPFGGQQIAPGGQQIALGGPEVTTSRQLFAPVGEQIAPSRPQVVPNLFAPFVQQNTPGQPQIAPGGQQFIPSEPQSTPGGQQFVSGGPQSATGGQQFIPGGPQPVTSGQQIAPSSQQTVPGGQQYQGNSPITGQFERTRSGKQYTETPNLSTPQNSGAKVVGVSQTNVRTSQKPMLAYAQMQIVDKKTDIHSKRPGEKDGLPPGLHEDDMLKLLYTFNYTLGFQAHFEEGYTNGEKRGYYYTTGRNGVRTRIDYVADENGFRPTLSQEVFDILSDDVPKADTEKEEKYGLKGYEFKWLYFPPDKYSQ